MLIDWTLMCRWDSIHYLGSPEWLTVFWNATGTVYLRRAERLTVFWYYFGLESDWPLTQCWGGIFKDSGVSDCPLTHHWVGIFGESVESDCRLTRRWGGIIRESEESDCRLTCRWGGIFKDSVESDCRLTRRLGGIVREVDECPLTHRLFWEFWESGVIECPLTLIASYNWKQESR